MKSLRPILLAFLLVLTFYFVTTRMSGPEGPSWVTRPAHVELTEAAGPSNYDPEEQNNIAVYKKALPAVVNITSTAVTYDFFYGAVPQQGMGSGFVIDTEGHILTNYHVVEGARQVEVTTSDKKKYKAQIIGTDPVHDLAVIQIPNKSVPQAEIGDSKSLVVGQKVYAIGNPFGLSGTMTRGIISSIRSLRGQRGFIDEAIQTDAAINPGNSGGPLLNARGQVIGINTMILTGGVEQSAGIGFAIPINTAKAVLDDLVHLGRVRRPELGVRTIPIGPELANQLGLAADSGLLVVEVVPGSAADRAGLRAGTERAYVGNYPIMLGGDLLVAIEGQPIAIRRCLRNLLVQVGLAGLGEHWPAQSCPSCEQPWALPIKNGAQPAPNAICPDCQALRTNGGRTLSLPLVAHTTRSNAAPSSKSLSGSRADLISWLETLQPGAEAEVSCGALTLKQTRRQLADTAQALRMNLSWIAAQQPGIVRFRVVARGKKPLHDGALQRSRTDGYTRQAGGRNDAPTSLPRVSQGRRQATSSASDPLLQREYYRLLSWRVEGEIVSIPIRGRPIVEVRAAVGAAMRRARRRITWEPGQPLRVRMGAIPDVRVHIIGERSYGRYR